MENNKKITLFSCVTAQHRHLLDQVLGTFNINQIVLRSNDNKSRFKLLSTSNFERNKVLMKLKPDFILVQGDTTTALFSSIAAFHHNIKVASEAGLRTNDKFSLARRSK